MNSNLFGAGIIGDVSEGIDPFSVGARSYVCSITYG